MEHASSKMNCAEVQQEHSLCTLYPKSWLGAFNIPTVWIILNIDLSNYSAMTSVWMKRTSSVEAWLMFLAQLLRLVFLIAGFIVMIL